MMRFACALLSVTLLSAENFKLPEPYQSMLDLAHTTPPEFAADALLRIAESGKIRDRNARVALTEEAFRLGSSAQYRMAWRALPGYESDSATAYLNQAYRLKLDALSLESRAVRDMLSLDKSKARELFNEVAQPFVPPMTCADALAPEVSAFYTTLGAVVQSSFNERERAKEEHINFLLGYLAQVTSPVQLAPAAALIKSLSLTPAQREVVFGRFNAILENISPDPRSFAATENDLKTALPPEMSASFEKYSRRGSAGARCGEDNAPKVDGYWQSSEAKQLFRKAMALRARPNGAMLAAAERSTPEWNLQLADFLRDLDQWTASDEKSEADFYHQKCIVYEALLDLTPPGEQRDKILDGFVRFMVGGNLQLQNPVEWFVHAPSLYQRMKDSAGEGDQVLEAYRASGNPVLLLFVTLEKAFSSGVPAWATGAAGSK